MGQQDVEGDDYEGTDVDLDVVPSIQFMTDL